MRTKTVFSLLSLIYIQIQGRQEFEHGKTSIIGGALPARSILQNYGKTEVLPFLPTKATLV